MSDLSPIAKYVLQQQLEEKMIYRRMLIENGRRCLEQSDRMGITDAIGNIFLVLDQIQQGDESVIQLHRECLSMIEHTQKCLALIEQMKPTVFKVDP